MYDSMTVQMAQRGVLILPKAIREMYNFNAGDEFTLLDLGRAFLDTSALFASVWSATGGSRMILKLGEAGAIQLLVSSQVLAEIDRTLRQKAPGILGSLALLLERSQVSVVQPPAEDILERCMQIVQHPGDAQILAAAWGSQIDYFVTLGGKHFIENKNLVEASPFPIGTPGDFLKWFRAKLS